jgi:hypothetical protein
MLRTMCLIVKMGLFEYGFDWVFLICKRLVVCDRWNEEGNSPICSFSSSQFEVGFSSSLL